MTVIRVFEPIKTENLEGTDYSHILSFLGTGGGMDSINENLQQNERMKFISESLNEMSVLSFMCAIREQKLDAPDTYNILIRDLTETINRSSYYSDERRINDIRNCLRDYAFLLKLDASEEILTASTFNLMEHFRDRGVTVTEEDVLAVFEGEKPIESEEITAP